MDSPLSTEPTSRIQACFLDRDGVLNKKMPEGHYVTRWSEFEVLPGVVEAIRHLNEAGILVIVVSNQRGIAKGLYTANDVEDMHTRFQSLLNTYGAHIDRFYFCPHDKVECDCRKPRPGMFEQARRDFPTLHAKTSVMIGDSHSDIEFGRQLGMLTIWIEGNKAHPRPNDEKASGFADLRFASLSQAVAALLRSRQ
jgi:D-glycero-D-manno-heptose 1,7-bisphosphate phosphatase